MRIMTAHKILISTATAFFLFYAAWEVARYFHRGELWALPRGLAALAVAVALGAYFAYVLKKKTIAGIAEGFTRPGGRK